MPDPVDNLRFRYPWRTYQKRVLEAVHEHLADRKLHIVAAPGSGKTVLGLEVFRLLGKPALVLCPTRIVRDQWIERLKLFMEPPVFSPPAWTSRDFDTLAFFNAITYQRLHSEYAREEKTLDDTVPTGPRSTTIARKLVAANIATIILDEAHHLRAAWWSVLAGIVERVPEATLVCLTATPPYDATGREWEKYARLCGPIDEEISIPELVREQNLCPHQDYVYATAVDTETNRVVRQRKETIESVLAILLSDPLLRFAAQHHELIGSESIPVGSVCGNVSLTVALAAYLRAADGVVPTELLRLLAIEEPPSMSTPLWEVLLKEYLFGRGWPEGEQTRAHRKEIAGMLRAAGLLWRRELRLCTDGKLDGRVRYSESKVRGIIEIVRNEWKTRDAWLRQVILCDHIHGDISIDAIGEGKATLGAWPVFATLALSLPLHIAQRFALVTGSLCVVPVTLFSRLCANEHIDTDSFEEIEGMEGFYRLAGVSSSEAVAAMTDMLGGGYLNGIAGTTALLGEGWDAPCVNSLILAGYANSYVLTNQSRGRAIRIDPADPGKVASIWHLLAVGEDVEGDLQDLTRRFKTFPGLSHVDTTIESSIERLGLPPHWTPHAIDRHNNRMLAHLSDERAIRRSWNEAVGQETKRLIPVITDRSPPRMGVAYRRAMTRVGALTLVGLSCGVLGMLPLSHTLLAEFRPLLLFAGLVALAGGGMPTLRSTRRWFRFRSPTATVHAMGEAVLRTLRELDEIDARGGVVETRRESSGDVCVFLAGGTFYEKNVFSNCLAQILAPLDNPRYVIAVPHPITRTVDYYAVPSMLACRKERATVFHRWWRKLIGPSRLLYTRSDEGRLLVLRSCAKALAAGTAPTHEIRNRWI